MNCIIAIATMANAEGKIIMLVRPIIMWAAIMKMTEIRNTALAGSEIFLGRELRTNPQLLNAFCQLGCINEEEGT